MDAPEIQVFRQEDFVLLIDVCLFYSFGLAMSK